MTGVPQTLIANDAAATELEHTSVAMRELVRRARLQADELALLAQRLEQLRREIDRHLSRGM